jgi:hypothetical protein
MCARCHGQPLLVLESMMSRHNSMEIGSSSLVTPTGMWAVQATFIATNPSVKAVRGLRLAGNKKYLAAVEQPYDDEAQQVCCMCSMLCQTQLLQLVNRS